MGVVGIFSIDSIPTQCNSKTDGAKSKPIRPLLLDPSDVIGNEFSIRYGNFLILGNGTSISKFTILTE